MSKIWMEMEVDQKIADETFSKREFDCNGQIYGLQGAPPAL